MASDDSTKAFDTSAFLQFLFSVVFLFVCCFTLMLYVDRALAIAIVVLLRFLVLPRNVLFRLGGLHVAPLQGRLLFRDVALQTENMSVHIVDGYVTLSFWGFWFKHPRWSRVHEYMVCETLVGTRCRVWRNLAFVKGTVVAVDVEKRKVSVQFDEQSTNSSSGDEDDGDQSGNADRATGTDSHPDPLSGLGADTNHSLPRTARSADDMRDAGEGRRSSPMSPMAPQRRSTLKEFTTPVSVAPNARKGSSGSNPHMRSEGLGDEVVKVVDANDVYVRSRAGLFQIHLNGLRVCIYNATGKYMDLAHAAAAQSANPGAAAASGSGAAPARDVSGGKDRRASAADSSGSGGEATRKLEALKENMKRSVVHWVRKAANETSRWARSDLDAQGMAEPQMSAEMRAARAVQEHNVNTPSFVRRFFNFIGCVEIEICSALIDLGAVGGTHPYFLHLTFQQGEGRVFLTNDSCPALDLYRFVTEMTMREVDIRMAQMDSKLSKTEVMRNATLYERARLLFSGVAESYEHLPFNSPSSSDLISQFGVFMDRKDKGTLHLVIYKDVANVYAGEPIKRDALPTTGVEVLIDTPVIRYGPWLEYCRTQLWQYFLPPNYLPLQELQFEVGMPRPNAGFEMLVLFLRDTTLEIPFKRRSIVPSPPFGIKDSKRKGSMVATIGAGAQYIQPAFFLLPKEEKQVLQGLFIAKDVTVWANCVLERETILCHADSVQFFFDRQDDRLWNGRKLFNILTKLSGVEMYFYMVYVDFFLDLLNDWQFAASMYHGAPLTTELFNTLNRSVRDFIPNVKRFEIFVESMASLYLNVNTHNVVYADDPNDLAHNIMAILKMQSGRFSMVLPSDQYQLSYENEVDRPLEASAREVKAYLSLPTSHPLYEQVSAEIPWAYAESLKVNGLFSMQVPNQSIPLQRDNLDPATGRTRFHNFFSLDVEFTNLRGTLMGSHIKALVQSFENIFLDNTFTIAPDELFWLLAKLQSHATTGKNKRKEFKQFLELSQPAGNDMEICVTVRLVDVSATVAAGQASGSPQINLSTGLVTFTYVKQFAVNDTAVTVSPITVRFPDRRGNFSRNAESSIVVGAVTVALTKNFGRMPLKPKVHESMEVTVDGAAVEVTAEQLMLVVEVAQTVARHMTMEDLMMEAEVAAALSEAEMLAERVVRAGPLRNTTDAPRGGMRRRRAGRSGAAQWNATAAAAAPGGSATFDGSFNFRHGSHMTGPMHGDDDEVDGDEASDSAGEAVEMQEWRSAQRAAAVPQDFQFPHESGGEGEGGEGEGGDIHVRVHQPPPPPQSALGMYPEEPMAEVDPNGLPILHSYEFDAARSSSEKHAGNRKRRRIFFAGSSSSSANGSDADRRPLRRRSFASTVPYDVALGFATFMDGCNKADDDSKDYGLFFLLVKVASLTAVVRIGEDGYAALELPAGLSMAQSTINDGNSNKRVSAAVQDVGLQLMLHRSSEVALGYLPSLKGDASVGNYLEVLSLHTSLCVRQYVAYPFDNSLEKHREKQRQFVEEHDYEQLISFPFKHAATHSPPSPPPPPDSLPTAAGQDMPSPVAKTQASAAAAPEPATLPRPTPPLSASRGEGGDAIAPSGPPTPAASSASPAIAIDVSPFPSGSLPLVPPTTRSWVPAGESLERVDSAAPAALPHAFTHGSRNSSLSSDSYNTTAHNQRAKGGGEEAALGKRRDTLSNYPDLSDTMLPDMDREKLEASNRFETCVSVSSRGSSLSTPFAGSTDDFFNSTSSDDSARRLVDNRAFAADRHSSSEDGRPNRRGSPAKGKSTAFPSGPQPPQPADSTKPTTTRSGPANASVEDGAVPAHLFYRTFDKAESDDNGVCAADYWPPQRHSGPQRVRDRTGFHAQLPITGFYPNTEHQCRAPLFFAYLRREALQRETDLFSWARCVADNRERSKHNSTSRHLHVALIDPLTVLVTPEAAVLAASAAQLFAQVHVSLRGQKYDLPRAASSSLSPGLANTARAAPPPRLLRSHAKKSKTRAQQKRWLWEDSIMSLAVPTVEVKLLTRLAVATENLRDPSRPVDGVYTSTLIVRHLRGLMAQNRPPSGEEVGDSSLKLSASLKVDTLAMVSQVEWEPLRREGNLFAKIPKAWYDTAKPTMAVVFLTEVAGKGKRDLWRGTDGGACNITTSQVAAHLTRDFGDYVHQLMRLGKEVAADVQRRLRAVQAANASVSSTMYSDGPPSLHPAGGQRSAEWGGPAGRPGEGVRVRKGRTVQGKGFVARVLVTLIDTQRVGERVEVRESEASRLELLKPFCNFVVVTPSLVRDRNVHIQGVGEIDLVKLHVLPSVLHVLHPRPVVRPTSPASVPAASPSSRPAASPAPTFLLSPSAVTGVESSSVFSPHAPLDAFAPGRVGGGSPYHLTSRGRGDEEAKPLQFIYDGTFTVHALDVSAKHSDTNYVQLLGKELTGCAESRLESVPSRECVQTEALTETISEKLKARLRYKANRARERAKRSRYPAPPESTEELHLQSTASFFANQVQLHYVAECVLHPISHAAGPLSETVPTAKQSIKADRVFSADITSVALVAQFAAQHNIHGDQTNLHMIVRNVVVDSPYCMRAAEMLHPQVHDLVSGWRRAVKRVARSMRRGSDGAKSTFASVGRRSFAMTDPGSHKAMRSSAVTLQMQATSITGYVGLPQGIVQKFLLPQISCFTKSSSNGRVDVKMHLHPFTITAHNAPQENYRVVLPHVYLLYAHDSIKMLCSVTMGTVAITITPLFINHTLLTYEKLMNDVLAVVASPSTPAEESDAAAVSPPVSPSDAGPRELSAHSLSRDDSTATHDTPTTTAGVRSAWKAGGRGRDGASSNPRGDGGARAARAGAARDNAEASASLDRDAPLPAAAPARRRRQSFLFLLQGVRFSYLTSMTTLRFTIRNLNATADTNEGDARHMLKWVVHVTDAQAALVDRDDHDQMIATYKNLVGAGNSESPTVSDLANIEASAFTNSRNAEMANVMKAAHPLGGFLWGSVGLSLTLSSGKVDENRARLALQDSASFRSYSEDLQQALLESFTSSTSKWELAVYEPLVVLRIGLDALVKQCIRETEEDVRELKRVSYEDNLTANLQLHRYRRFQRLQVEKKRIDGLIRRAQKERQRKLRSMTERVVHDVTQRRGGLLVRGSEGNDDVLDFFSTVKLHRVVATVTNFMVVIPFGDAAFRSVLEELPETFACGKSDRHIHSASCLNRRKFIPTYALKLRVHTVSYICNLEISKRLVPVLVSDPRLSRSANDSVYATGGSADQGYSTTMTFLGRLLALDSHVFFTNGSPLKGETSLQDVLRTTSILGGQGLLSSYAADEHERSLNSIAISSIEAPLRVERRANTMTVGVVVDVSEPRGRMSSLLISILRELSLEQPTTRLETHVAPRRRFPRTASASDCAKTRHGPGQRVLYSEESEPPAPKPPLSLHLDITGRLEASELAVYCYSNPERFSTAAAGQGAGGGMGTGGVPTSAAAGARAFGDARGMRPSKLAAANRRVGFDTTTTTTTGPTSTPHGIRWRNVRLSGPDATPFGLAENTQDRYLIMSIPLPGVVVRAVVRRGRREGGDDVAMIRAEVRAGTIELSPYITALAQEVEMCTTVYQQHRIEHSKKILDFVQEMEGEVPQLGVPLHCALIEVLLPMPRAYASVLAKEEMNTVVRLRRSQRRTRAAAAAAEAGEDSTVGESGTVAAPVAPPRRARGLTAVHVTISDFRLIFNTEPAASTFFTVYLDSGGTIDFVFKHFVRSDSAVRFVNKFPDVSLAVTLRRLRAECQTKLEVKSLELFLPEAEATLSRRSGQIGVADTIAVYFPFNVEGTEPNVTLRLQHVSQLFLVIDMWSFTAAETLRSVRHLFARGAAGDDIAKRVKRTELGRQVAKGNQALREMQQKAVDRHTLVFVGLTRALCFCDLGAGSAHNFSIGEAHIAAEAAHRASGCAVNLLMGRVANVSIRSEGVLSGGMIIGDICVKGFVIQNTEDAEVFVRTPDQRTFREALMVRQVHVNFKERQLKDVFECKVGEFRGNSMDGIGEEDFTTTDLDVSLCRGTLGVTPSTVPAFLSFVRNISAIVTEQRRISAVKLKEKTLHLQPVENAKPTAEGDAPSFFKKASIKDDDTTADSEDTRSTASTQPARRAIPFFGNRLMRVPCGQLRVAVDDTTVLLGAISSGEATAGCVVISFSKGRFSFAECPCDDYHAAKKVLVIETHNVELYRPGTPRVVVMGFHGVNHFEFYTRQVLGSPEVGFTLTLRQTNPWTGNPRFRDFEEMIQLLKSFTDKKNAEVIKQFGRIETTMFDSDMSSIPLRRDSAGPASGAGGGGGGAGMVDLDSHSSPSDSVNASPAVQKVAAVVDTDERHLKALRSSKFSPQLRFGGDVSVNTEVILNWLGVTEKMLPHVVHMALCDKLEKLLFSLSALASERVRKRRTATDKNEKPPTGPKPAESRRLDF